MLSSFTTQDTEVDGIKLEPGMVCSVNIQNVHHNPALWTEPWTFDPDRFAPEASAERDSHAFIPFSAGPRNCIGQHFAMNEQKVMLARLLRR